METSPLQPASPSFKQLASARARRACAVLWASPFAAPARRAIEKRKINALGRISHSESLAKAVFAGDSAECARLLSERPARPVDRQVFLRHAATNGHADIIKLLLSGPTLKDKTSTALCFAAGNGHAECVRLLIPISNPKIGFSYALRWAAEDGHAECVRLLLPVSDVLDRSPGKDCALASAAKKGHADCVAILAPASDKTSNAHALFLASHKGHVECVRLLIPFSPPLIAHPNLLSAALLGGNAQVVELISRLEPQLLLGIDLSKCLAIAKKARQNDLAALLSSLHEKQALSAAIADAGATRGSGRPPRL